MKEALCQQFSSILKQHKEIIKKPPQINIYINGNINSGNDSSNQTRSHSKCSRESSSGPQEKPDSSVYKLIKAEKIYKINDTITDERKQLISRNSQYQSHYNKIAETNLSYYKLLKLIGTGSFGKVLLAECILTGKLVAIKAFDKEYLKDQYSKNKVTREIYLQRNINHENVIRLFEVFYNETHLFIVMEYACNGDLLHYLKTKKRLADAEARKFFRQIVYGLAHIHCRSILHRDIKLDNLLLDEDMGVKICDFGVSRILSKSQLIKEQCGTPAYLAPEIINNKGYSGYNSDLWSLGIVLYAMLCGTVPYRGNSLQELLNDIKIKEVTYPPYISKDASDLISKLLVFDPYKRICVADILKHPWFRGNGVQTNEENAISIKEDTSDKSDITEVKLCNLFDNQIPKKIYMHDYPFISQCDISKQLNLDCLRTVESFGYSREAITKSLKEGEMNHATACYYLLAS